MIVIEHMCKLYVHVCMFVYVVSVSLCVCVYVFLYCVQFLLYSVVQEVC